MVVTPQRRFHPVIVAMIAVTLVASILAVIDARDGGDLYRRLALLPARVWQGEVWRLVTWVFVEASVVSLVFGSVSLWWFGGDLIEEWGTPRFVRYVLTVVLAAAAGTCLIALVLPTAWGLPHLGGLALGDALVIAWALTFPASQIRIYQVLDVGGPVLAYGTVGFTVLLAVFYGLAFFLPELLAGVVALTILRKKIR